MITSLDSSRLEALLESAQLLYASPNVEELLKHLLRTAMGRLLVTRGLVAIASNSSMQVAVVRNVPSAKIGDTYSEANLREVGLNTIFAIGNATQPIGFLAVNSPATQIDPQEEAFVRALLSISASGIDNALTHAEAKQLNKELDQKVQDLRALLDLVRALATSLEPEDIARILMLTLAGRWAVRKYAMAAWKDAHPAVLRHKGMELPDIELLKKFLVELPEVIKVADLPEGDIKTSLINQQAEVLFPLHMLGAEGEERRPEDTRGLIVLGPRATKLSYSSSDLEFGAGVVGQAGVAFENSWYFREVLEKKKMEQELLLAAGIQQRLFPTNLPKLTNCELAARNRPALQCGGDYYDVIAIDNGVQLGYLLCVADVSGKGLPASLLMSNTQAALQVMLGYVPSMVTLSARINDQLYLNTPSYNYVTGILVQFDPETGQGCYVNGGHVGGCLLRASGEVEWMTPTGRPFGLLPRQTFEEVAFQLHSGDILALYSDGVTEAQDINENDFTEPRYADFLRTIRDESAADIVAKSFAEIDRFAGEAPQHDDITLMILKRQ